MQEERNETRETAERVPVTVVLLVRNPGDRELETLRLVQAQEYDGTVVLSVVDSSDDPSVGASAELRKHADLWRSILPSEFHHGSTRNLAVEACTTPIVVFLSSDAHPVGSGWLAALVRPLEAGLAEVSYGRQRAPVADAERDATYSYLYPDEAEIKTRSSAAAGGIRSTHFSDVHSAYLRSVLEEIPFPSDIPIFQDAAIAKLMFDAGYRIAYESDAIVLHAHPMTWRYMWDRYRGLGEVYERFGMFDAVASRGHGALVREGLRSIRAMVPKEKAGIISSGRAAAVGAVKALAVATGRRDARKRAPLELDWDAKGGSRAVRRKT